MSVAPNLTELLFAAGAADQVVGVSAYSDYPEAARALPQIGDAFRLDYERIVALAPTVAVDLDRHARGCCGAARGPRHPRGRHPDPQARRGRNGPAHARHARAHRAGRARGRQPVSVDASKNSGLSTGTGRPSRIRPDRRGAALHDRRPSPHHGDRRALRRHVGDATALALPVDLESALAVLAEVILVNDADPSAFWARFNTLAAVSRGNVYRAPADALGGRARIADGAADVCARLDEARAKIAAARLR